MLAPHDLMGQSFCLINRRRHNHDRTRRRLVCCGTKRIVTVPRHVNNMNNGIIIIPNHINILWYHDTAHDVQFYRPYLRCTPGNIVKNYCRLDFHLLKPYYWTRGVFCLVIILKINYLPEHVDAHIYLVRITGCLSSLIRCCLGGPLQSYTHIYIRMFTMIWKYNIPNNLL